MVDIKAYAKINLSLEVLDKLPDGLHKIRSIFQAVDFFDIISISKMEKGYHLTGSVVCLPGHNLVTKSKEALEVFVEKELPCRINLAKNIPVCAGLGGGSSDAAAVLIGLNNVYELGLSLEQLLDIGFELGSDVPFFIANKGTALVEGLGERIKSVEKKVSKFYVLARPHKRISTAEMYALYDKTGRSFFELAQGICPSLEGLYSHFKPRSRDFGMSGTGPTVFAGFNSYAKALKAVEGFGIENFNGDFFVCRSSSRTYELFE